ncbi:MAG: FHA domain-containing protein [Paludisphaera borealis]|nr:FHA domain-containing protein [Paludisphaera borealis]MDR3623140.1 FHA domain-containing protein [Paludisphaera borealis]
MSRLHAYFQAVGSRLFCLDLSSRTGIALADRPGSLDRGWLDPDQVVNIGGHGIRRIVEKAGSRGVGSTVEPPGTTSVDPPRLPEAALELPIRTGEDHALWRIPSMVALIGRAVGCDMTLTDDSVSRFHASFVRTPGGLWVVDLRSREGVFVGGIRVRWAWLDDGDSVRIGRFTFIVRCVVESRKFSRQNVSIAAGAMPVAATESSLATSSQRSRDPGRALAVRPGPAPGSLLAASPTLDHSVAATSVLGAESPRAWQPASLDDPMPPAIWQQQMQMMESFHNDMILMVQMFVAMHQEHQATMRVELDRVEQLTRELSGLQQKLALALPQE